MGLSRNRPKVMVAPSSSSYKIAGVVLIEDGDLEFSFCFRKSNQRQT